MVKPTLSGSWSSANDRGIQRVEAKLGFIFPKVYSDFLKKNNGGRPIPNAFNVGEEEHKMSIFYGIGGGEEKDLSIFYKRVQRFLEGRYQAPEREQFKDLLPFAEDEDGNILFLNVDTTIVLILDRKGKGEPNLETLCAFMEFLGSFYPSGDEVHIEEGNTYSEEEDDEYNGDDYKGKQKKSRKRKTNRKYGDDDDDDY